MKKLILFLTILIPSITLSQSDADYIRVYIEKPELLYKNCVIIFSDTCTNGADWCCDAIQFGGPLNSITTTIGNTSYVFNCFPKITQDRIIPLNINISPDTGVFIIGIDLSVGNLPPYALLDSQFPGYHQMPYICYGPVSNGRFSILFEYPMTVDVISGCESGYVIINNDESSVPYELMNYYDPSVSYNFPPNTDTIFDLPNGDYILTLNDSITEQAQFSVSNTTFNDELVIPYSLLTIQDPYIIPYLIMAASYDEISWNFGDGTPILYNDINPVHGYTQTGIYTLEVIITRNGCSKTLQQTITIYNPLGIQSIYPIIPNNKKNQYYYGIDGRLIRAD